MATDIDGINSQVTTRESASVFVMDAVQVGALSQITVTTTPASVGSMIQIERVADGRGADGGTDTSSDILKEVEAPASEKSSTRKSAVDNLLHLDVKDIGVMVGLGMFTGSTASVVWDLLYSSPAPSHIALPLAFTGFIFGGFLTLKSRRARHAGS